MPNKELLVKIRRETGLSVMEISKALKEANNDETKARELLRQRGAEVMSKKQERAVKAGLIDAYSHNGRIGVLVELQCETDFVARNGDFKEFAHDLSLQVSAMNPATVDELLEQPYIKDESQTINQLLTNLTAKMGEKIVIARFARYEA
ncbi:MAG: elongation factor Ts [bacterium]|nr:elongation factor Ts [bacterium]